MYIGRSTACLLAGLFVRVAVLNHLVVAAAVAGTAGYHIGNSLTWGSHPKGMAAMALAAGKEHVVGYHIRSGWSLSAIWNNPNNITVTNDFGGFMSALPNYPWDYVTLQPHHSNTTLASDRQRIIDFVNLNEAGPSSGTRYYIYSAWPRLSSGDYKSFWTQPVSNVPAQPTIHAREYFAHLHRNAKEALGSNITVQMIPVGEVLYQVDLLFESGAVPGFSDVSQLYGDDNHLTGDIGGWIAANTVYATVFRESPVGLKKPDGFFLPPEGSPSKLTDELNARLQALIWDVVSHHPSTGIDIEPDPFEFNDVANVDLNITKKSNAIEVRGINAQTDISIAGGKYSVNSGHFTANNGTVKSGDSVRIKVNSATTYATAAHATLTIGGVSDTFTVTTLDGAGPGYKLIDILPGDDSNVIAPLTDLVVWVAILTSEALDAREVDPQTVRFGPLGAAPRRYKVADVDGDGDKDVRFKFKVGHTGIACGDTSATLIAETFSGARLDGSEQIQTTGCQ